MGGSKLNEFLALIGQLFLIVCLQSVLELFIDATNKPHLVKLLSIACYAGSLYLLLQFVFNNLMPEMFSIFRMVF